MQGEWAKQMVLLCEFASTTFDAASVSLHAYREAGETALLLAAVKNMSQEIIVEDTPVSAPV